MTMALRMIMMMPTSLASWSAASSSLLCSARSVASLVMIMIKMIGDGDDDHFDEDDDHDDEDGAEPAGVFNGKAKHNKRHRCF